MHRAVYRSYQFFSAVRAYLPRWAGGLAGGLSPEDEALVHAVLPAPDQRDLFYRMPPNDRRHALAVARTLRQAGYTHPALLQAALLHDAGKSLGQPLIHRVLIVLLRAFWPTLLHRLGHADPQTLLDDDAATSPSPRWPGRAWWRRPFVIHAHHPAIAAAWAEQAGCLPQAVALIREHEKSEKHKEHPRGIDSPLAAQNSKFTIHNSQFPAPELLRALQWADDQN